VLTGTYEALGRTEATDLIKRHSGRVTGSVSGKTTFLVAGDGCSKSKLEAVRDGARPQEGMPGPLRLQGAASWLPASALAAKLGYGGSPLTACACACDAPTVGERTHEAASFLCLLALLPARAASAGRGRSPCLPQRIHAYVRAWLTMLILATVLP
jgi:hypothetical protein